MLQKINKGTILYFSIFLIFILFLFLGYSRYENYFTVEALKEQRAFIQATYSHAPFLFTFCFSIFYILANAIALPGISFFTLGAGLIFGFWRGSLFVATLSTTGATLLFIFVRYFYKEKWYLKNQEKFLKIEKTLNKNVFFNLLYMRMIPLFPFVMVNSLMAFTSISLKEFFLATLLGMLPFTFIYVSAGTQLSHIQSFKDIYNMNTILLLLLIIIFPLVVQIGGEKIFSLRGIFQSFKNNGGSKNNKDSK